MVKPDNVLVIKSSFDEMFRYWLTFLRPVHNLTDREIDVVSGFIRKRYELSKSILDEELLDKNLMNESTKRTIRDECGLTVSHFQIILSKLKKKKVIVENKISPKYIPRINENAKGLQLLIYFQIDGL